MFGGNPKLCQTTDGLVRTVRVGMRQRDAREPNLPYKSKILFEVEMPIQMPCLIVPVDDVQLAEKEEVSVRVNLDGTNAEALPTRPKMPIMTVEDDADSIEDLERVDAVAHTPHHT